MRATLVPFAAPFAALFVASAALAQPINDDFADAAIVDALPFADSTDTAAATTEATDPGCYGNGPTVWYAYPAPVVGEATLLEANTFGSAYDTTLTVMTGSAADFVLVGCNDDTDGLQSRVTFTAQPGELYFILVGAFADGAGGALQFNLDVAPPPPPGLEISVAVSGATVSPSRGMGTVSGSVTCSNDSEVWINGRLSQKVAGTLAYGFFGGFVFCAAGSTTPFSAVLTSEPVRGNGRSTALLRGGPAIGVVEAGGMDAYGQNAFASANVELSLRATR